MDKIKTKFLFSLPLRGRAGAGPASQSAQGGLGHVRFGMGRRSLRCLVWSCLLCPPAVWADTVGGSDTLSLNVSAGLTRDDNLFRAPQGREVSDEIRTTTLGLRFSKTYSLQRFYVDAQLIDYRYRDNSYLDFTGKNLNAAWAWKLTPSLYGNLSTSRIETLNSFVDYVAANPELRRNIRTMKRSRFDVEWEALGPLHLLSAVSHYEQDNSQTFFEDSAYSAHSAEAGIKYVTSADSSLALVSRKTNGKYSRTANPVTLADSGFEQQEHEARFVWNLTVKSSATGRVAYLERRHDRFRERDFDGYVGSLDLKWGITDKVDFNIGLRRDLNAYQQVPSPITSYSNYYVANSYSLNPVWRITEKTSLGYRHTRQQRDFEGTVVGPNPLRNDRLRYDTLSLDWAPRDFLQVGLDYQKTKRNSSDDNFDFKANAILLTLRLSF